MCFRGCLNRVGLILYSIEEEVVEMVKLVIFGVILLFLWSVEREMMLCDRFFLGRCVIYMNLFFLEGEFMME